MDDPTHDFGTGLRAHLGLERTELDEPLDETGPTPDEPAEARVDELDEDASTLETLIAFEHELLERERELARRENALSARAGALLAAAQSLHDEVVRGTTKPRDELARMRRRKSGAA